MFNKYDFLFYLCPRLPCFGFLDPLLLLDMIFTSRWKSCSQHKSSKSFSNGNILFELLLFYDLSQPYPFNVFTNSYILSWFDILCCFICLTYVTLLLRCPKGKNKTLYYKYCSLHISLIAGICLKSVFIF